jgi:hypothetical protein
MVALVVKDVCVHVLVDAAQVEKWDHGIAVVLGMVVRIPQQSSNDDVAPDASSVPQAVGLLGYFAVGVLEVAEVVDAWVPDEDWDDPPEEKGLDALPSPSQTEVDGKVERDLSYGSHLDCLHDTRLLGIGPVLETPAPAAVVDGDSEGRAEDFADAAFEGRINVEELSEVREAAKRQVTEAWVFELLPSVVARKLGVEVNVVGKRVVLRNAG